MVQLYNCWIHPFTISLDAETGGTSSTAAHINTVKSCAILIETFSETMVTQPSNAQGVEFNLQYRTPILNLAITRFRIRTYWIYQKNIAMRQRLECQ